MVEETVLVRQQWIYKQGSKYAALIVTANGKTLHTALHPKEMMPMEISYIEDGDWR